MSDYQVALHMVFGMPPEYDIFRRSMKAGGADFNFQAFKQSLLEKEEKMRAPIPTVAPTRALLDTNRGEFPRKGKQRHGGRGFHQAGDNRAMIANRHQQEAGQQMASPGPGPSYGPPSHAATTPRGAAGPRYGRGRGYTSRYRGLEVLQVWEYRTH